MPEPPYLSSGMPFRFGPGACCCRECWTFSDTFERLESTSVGDSWNEVTGDWGIDDDGHLIEKWGGGATANSVLMCTVKSPAMNDNGLNIIAEVADTAVGDTIYIYVHAEDSDSTDESLAISYERLADDGVYARWEVTIPGGGADGTKTLALGGGPLDYCTLWVCTDNRSGMVKAGILNIQDHAWDDNVPAHLGRYYGIGHNNTRASGYAITVESFGISEVRTPYGECLECFCHCDETGLPRVLTATITGATGRAACLEGLTWDLEWEAMAVWGDPTHRARWTGTAQMPHGNGIDTISQEVTLYCFIDDQDPSNSLSRFKLIWEPNDSDCQWSKPGFYEVYPDDNLSTCDPLKLVFPDIEPYQHTTGWCDVCYEITTHLPVTGEFYVEITL